MKTSELIAALQSNPFVLAPMAGITDSAFRSFMRDLGAGILISELVSAHGLKHNSIKTRRLMDFTESQRPVGIQIFGETPEAMAEAARIVEATGADFVDINFGCPVPKVVKKGAGSALLKDLPMFAKVLGEVKAAVQLPVTIKVRTGWDQNCRNTDEVVKIAYEEGITWVAIHGRTRAAGYSGKADWDYIRWVKSVSRLPIIGNGDIHSAASAVERLSSSQCDGVMIGRGCLKNPWIFSECMALWKRESAGLRSREFLPLLQNLRRHLEENCEPRIVSLQMKKFAAWYAHGYPNASNFRKNLFQSLSPESVEQTIFDYFSSIGAQAQADTSHEPFLMGGHG